MRNNVPPRPIERTGAVAFVPLTRGFRATIDAADIPLVEGGSWTASVRGSRVYAYRQPGGKHLMMHRAILGAPASLDVDHINGDTLDNRRANLRVATRAQNIQNMRPRPGRTLPTGVRMNPRGKFVAWLRCNYQYVHLGTHDTVEAATAARREGEDRYFGEFAWR